jgi:hypothetical protein
MPSSSNSSCGDRLRQFVRTGVLLFLVLTERGVSGDDPSTVTTMDSFYRDVVAVKNPWQRNLLIDHMAARLAATGQFEALEVLIRANQESVVNTSAVVAAVNELLESERCDEARRVLNFQPMVLLPAGEKERIGETLIPGNVKAEFQSKFGLAIDWCSQAIAGNPYEIPSAELPMSFKDNSVVCILVASAQRGDAKSLSNFLNRAVAPELHDRARALMVFRLIRMGQLKNAEAVLSSIHDPLVAECCRTIAKQIDPTTRTATWPRVDIRSFCLVYPTELDCHWQNLELCCIEGARGNVVAARRMLLHEHAALCARKPTGKIDIGIFPAGEDARQRAFVARLAASQQMPQIAISSLEPLRGKAFEFWIDMISETVHFNRGDNPSDLDAAIRCAVAIGQLTPRKTTAPQEWSSEFDASDALFSTLKGIEQRSLDLKASNIPSVDRCRLLLHAAPRSRLKELLHFDNWNDLSRNHKLWACSMTKGLISSNFIEFELNERSDPVLTCAAMMQIESGSPLIARAEKILPILLLSHNREVRYFAMRWARECECRVDDRLLEELSHDPDIDVRFLALVHKGQSTDKVVAAAENVINNSENSLLAGEAARWAFEQESLDESTLGLIEKILAQGKQFPILCGMEVWVANGRNRSKAQSELEKIAALPNSTWLEEQSKRLLSSIKGTH